MIKTFEKKMIEQNGQAVKYIKAVGLKDSTGTIKNINEQIARDFGLAGPLTLSTVSERVHAVRWVTARESYVVESSVKRVTKEIVAASVAQVNRCPYCEDAHGTSIVSAGDKITSKKIANGTWQTLKGEKKKQIIEWSLNTRNPNAEIIKNPPFSIHEAPEIIGTALVFHSTNRLVSIFLEESPLPNFLSGKLIKKTALKIAAKTLFKSMVEKQSTTGDGLEFINDYPIPTSLKWSKSIPPFSKALAAEQVVLNEIEEELIPKKLAQLFIEKVNSWQGEEMPMGRSWLNEVIKPLSENEKPIAQIMFLAAFTPFAVTGKDIEDFRKAKPGDAALVEVCYWSIQLLTNRLSKWLVKPFIN